MLNFLALTKSKSFPYSSLKKMEADKQTEDKDSFSELKLVHT